MAKVLKAFPAGCKGHGRYPWNEWLDGRTWELKRGVDFECSTISFRTSAYAMARKRSQQLRSVISDDAITLQAYKADTPDGH